MKNGQRQTYWTSMKMATTDNQARRAALALSNSLALALVLEHAFCSTRTRLDSFFVTQTVYSLRFVFMNSSCARALARKLAVL